MKSKLLKTLIFLAIMLMLTAAGCSCEISNIEDIEEDPTKDSVSKPDEPESANEWQSFEDSDLGFAVSYPPEWEYGKTSNIVEFHGPEGDDSYYTTVNIQNLVKSEDNYPDIGSVFDDMEFQIESADGKVFNIHERPVKFAGKEYNTIRFESTYTMGEEFCQKTTIIEREELDVFHMLTYTAPSDLYEDGLDAATLIKDSFTPITP